MNHVQEKIDKTVQLHYCYLELNEARKRKCATGDVQKTIWYVQIIKREKLSKLYLKASTDTLLEYYLR